MSFRIDFDAFLSTLPVMFYGMAGGLLIMLVICGILMLLYRFSKGTGDSE